MSDPKAEKKRLEEEKKAEKKRQEEEKKRQEEEKKAEKVRLVRAVHTLLAVVTAHISRV
jgi:hypothetical protein